MQNDCSYMNAEESSLVLPWVGGKTGGAIWVCLDFLAPPFVLIQKVEILQQKDCLIKEVTSRCRIKSSMTGESGNDCKQFERQRGDMRF
jgi:hypothetical protein